MEWLLKWGSRAIGVVLCATGWLIAVGIYSFGTVWYSDTVGVHSIDDLLLYGIVLFGGEMAGAIFFFLGGIFMLWVFWRA